MALDKVAIVNYRADVVQYTNLLRRSANELAAEYRSSLTVPYGAPED